MEVKMEKSGGGCSWNTGCTLRCETAQAGCAARNEYMKDDFFIKIETWHKPDLGTLENVHGLDQPTWKSVEVVPIDIADKEQVAPGTVIGRFQIWPIT
ncbi:hypothetical protein JZ751_021448 [Albula glossodonta]|uniref:Phosphatidylinositol transfer protein beta isoform n=1 Tax=Albula glossodonta TaxID=121402 RepID=A0A8T2MZR5_9TELE|nr:hypothetical protein JZ751_021448 [Albula glossodonta]